MTTVAQTSTIHTVRGGGGLRLQVREWGRADGPPVLFIHGLSQNHLCWAKQYQSTLAEEFRLVAYDLRGHGMSQAPLEPEHYTDAQLWADDLAAIIDQLGLDRPVLVGWSYGGFVICDYLRAHGQDRIAAIDFAGAVVTLGQAAFGTLIGPGFLDHFPDLTAEDLPTNILGMRGLVKGWPARPYPAEEVETLLCSGMTVPARIRANLGAREIDGDDVLRTLGVPLLVSHGRGGHRRAPGDGRARPGHLPDRRALLVRRDRPHPVPGGPRALQRRARRADPPRPHLMVLTDLGSRPGKGRGGAPVER
jgi:non-heme chloroperoxidase